MKIIDGKKWYTPREIAEMGLIKNRRGDLGSVDGRYIFILKIINAGKLDAHDYSVGSKRPYWLVSEDSISAYHNGLKTKVSNGARNDV